MMPRVAPSWIAVSLALVACGDPRDARDLFDARVLPVLERSCAAPTCHGVAPDAEARGDRIDWNQLYFRLDDRGRIADAEGAYAACKRAINTVEDPAFSSLLRKPLAVESGGLPHYGGASFSGTEDPSYRAVHDWIASETEGGEDPAPLDELEQLFAETVQPVLVEGTCLTSRCHGPTAGATPYRLDIGYRGRFPIAATRHNYEQTLAVVTLDGYPFLSRVLRKAQALGPGIVHKGLNFDFFTGNPGGGTEAIVAWICAERRARAGVGCATAGEPPISAFVFVRGPVAPHPAFALDTFVPGSDLHLATVSDASLAPASIENLTESLHPDGPADVREPAVSRDGLQVVFSMRRHAGEGHHIWLLDLASREARQLTSGGGPLPGGGTSTDRDPTWGPDGTIWFVSTRAGIAADRGELLDADIYSIDLDGGGVRRWTHTPHVERRPVFLDLGDEAGGEVSFSALRDAIPAQRRAHIFRFPPSQRTEYHQHFGVTPIETFFYDLRELPDGRYVSVVGDLPAVWEAGRLAIIERNFGPEINGASADQTPALEIYEPPMVALPGDGVYRDPAPLPDGRILVSHQPGPFDPADAGAAFTPRLELLEIAERATGAGPTVARATVILDEPGMALTEPEPVSRRAPVRSDGVPLPPSDDPTAVFRHHGLPMVEALLANLAPAGDKRPLDGIAHVRLVEHVPSTLDERVSIGLGPHGRARILAELPVAADGSFQARVPTGVAFRIQPLDASRMAIGTMHNRWYYTLPGQVLTQGISVASGTARYGSQCAACHGDPDGVGGRPPELQEADAVTSASLVLSRFERQNPRRPIDPPIVGAETRIDIDFRLDVQPILDARCTGCHAGTAPAGALDLTGAPGERFSVSYENLLRPGSESRNGRAYVDDSDGRARSSYLIELITGRELEAPAALSSPGTPHPALGAGGLTEDELLVLIRWIELGAAFRAGEAESAP
jgi:hypothetical protein